MPLASADFWYLYVLTFLAGYALYAVRTGRIKVGRENLQMTSLFLLAFVVTGLYLVGAGSYVNEKLKSPFLSVGVQSSDTGTDGQGTDGQKNSDVANKYQIATFNVQLVEKYSNSYTATDGGWLKIYDANKDPADANTEPITKIAISSGTGSATNPSIYTDTPYRVVYDGNGTWYDEDFGVIQFSSKDYDREQGNFLFSKSGIARIASIDDILDETATDGTINGQSSTNISDTSIEIGCVNGCSADATLVYDESNGDGTFYIEPTFSFSGANSEIRKAVLCFDHDDTNPPEGNEITGFVAQSLSGTDFGLPSDLTGYWKKESCVSLGRVIRSGSMGKVRFTITVDESKLDANDDWSMIVDDLGKKDGKDIVLNIGATKDTVNFDAQA